MEKIFLIVSILTVLFEEILSQGTQGSCFCAPQGYCNTNNNVPNNNNNGSPNNNNNGGAGGNYGDGNIDMRIQPNPNGDSQPNNFYGSQQQLTSAANLQTMVTNQQCQNGLQQCCPPGGYQCGMRFPPPNNVRQKEIGQSAYGGHPWLALIVRQTDSIFQGTGALIDHQHVLTAAHRLNASIYERQPLQVHLGRWDFTNEVYPTSVHSVVKTFVHQKYSPTNLKNDIAILRISPNAMLGAYPSIGTVCLPLNPIQSNIRCWVAGYGSSTLHGSQQPLQKEIHLPLVDSNTCQNLLKQTRLGQSYVLDTVSFMCAGGEQGNDACTGDGGAPLVCSISNQWFVMGLVAWGINCGTNTPGVYVNVASYTNWIQQTIGRLN